MTKAEIKLKIIRLMASANKAEPRTRALLLSYVRTLRQRLAWAK